MLLAVDLGNTNLVAAVFSGPERVTSWRLGTDRARTADDYGVLFQNLLRLRGVDLSSIDAVAVCSVVPPLTPALAEMARTYFGQEAFVASPGRNLGLVIDYHPPTAVGPDRVVNAIGGIHRYGTPLILVDFGTATTLDVVTRDGVYRGGAVAPGVGISADALFERAAGLPRIELASPGPVIGKDTAQAMLSGLIYGSAGLVDVMVQRIRAEIGADARVVATGGLASLVAPHSATIQAVDEWLTVEGLRLAWEARPQEGCA